MRGKGPLDKECGNISAMTTPEAQNPQAWIWQKWFFVIRAHFLSDYTVHPMGVSLSCGRGLM